MRCQLSSYILLVTSMTMSLVAYTLPILIHGKTNRKIYAPNKNMDTYVLKPVAKRLSGCDTTNRR